MVLNLNELAKFTLTSTIGGLVACGSAVGATTGSIKGEFTVTGSKEGVHTPIMVE